MSLSVYEESPHKETTMMSFQIILIVLASAHGCYGWDTIIETNVLGRPWSNDAPLYSKIADIILYHHKENGTFNDNYYCKLHFQAMNFDTSSGGSTFNSLSIARQSFKSDKIAVAIGPFIDVFASTNYVILKQLHILTSPPGPNVAMMDPNKVVHILPDSNSIAIAIAQCAINLGWQDVAFIFTDDYSPIKALQKEQIIVFPMIIRDNFGSPDDPDLEKNLLTIRNSGKKRFILHTSNRETVWNVLQAAKRLDMLHHTIEWLVTYLDFEDFFQAGGSSLPGIIFGFQLLRPDVIPKNVTELMSPGKSRLELGVAYDVVGLLRDILLEESPGSPGCYRMRQVKDYYISPEFFNWRMKNKDTPYEGVLGVYAWDEQHKRTNLTVDILRYNGSLSKIGDFMLTNGTVEMSLEPIIEFDNEDEYVFDKEVKLKVATKLSDPFMIKQGDGYMGFGYDLLTLISKKLNFEFELHEVEDRNGGGSDDWNGMVYALTSGNASIAMGALELTAQRERKISFSHKIQSSQASVLIKKQDSTTNYFQFFGPFSIDLWLMILAFTFVAAVSLYVFSRFDPNKEGAVEHFDLKESAWYAVNIVLQGTTDFSPDTTSMRAIIAFFWFCILIIDAAYTANLAAYLTLQQIDDRVTSTKALADQNKVMYGVENGSDIMNFFKKNREEPYERMWANILLRSKDAIITNSSDVIARVQGGQFAFIADGVTNKYYANQHCGIESVDQSFGYKDFAIGVPRAAPYLDDINKALLQLNEAGTIDALKRKWWAAGVNCTGDDNTRFINQKSTSELGLTNMIGVFIVLCGFIVLSIITYIIECIVKQRDKKIKEKKEKESGLNHSKEKENTQDNHVDSEQPLCNNQNSYGVK